METGEAIAVEVGFRQYKRAENRGPYEIAEEEFAVIEESEEQKGELATFAQNNWYYVAMILLVVVGIVFFKCKARLNK